MANKGITYVFTLAFNLPIEIEQRTKELYERNPNSNFKHYIVDLGFPLEYGSDIPDNIELVKQLNTALLRDTCKRYGSTYMQFENIGVSQNYTQFMKAVDLKDEDILICCDPDEIVHTDNWVDAIVRVLKDGNSNMAYCGLCMDEQLPLFESNQIAHDKLTIDGIEVYKINGIISCAQWGFSGRFLNQCGGVGVPNGSSVYGYIESAVYEKKCELGWNWCVLPEYLVEHSETSTIYREWKTDITSNVKNGQPSFESWLKSNK